MILSTHTFCPHFYVRIPSFFLMSSHAHDIKKICRECFSPPLQALTFTMDYCFCRRKRKWDQPAEGIVSAAGAMPGLFPMAAAGAFTGLGALSSTFPFVNYFPAASVAAAQSTTAQINPSATVQQNAAAIVQKFNQVFRSCLGQSFLPFQIVSSSLI